MLHNQPESSQELLRRNNRDLVDVMGGHTDTPVPALATASNTRFTRVQPTGHVKNMRTLDTAMKLGRLIDPALDDAQFYAHLPAGYLNEYGPALDEADIRHDPAAVGATKVGHKLAWEDQDEDGSLMSNWPLRYAARYAPEPSNRRVGVPPSHPEYDQKFVAAQLAASLKKLPAGRKLHWVDPLGVVGQRAWYNPARYTEGRNILGVQKFTLDAAADDAARAQMASRIAASSNGSQSPLYAYLPPNDAADLYEPWPDPATVRHDPDVDAYRAFGADDTEIAKIQAQAAAHNARLDAVKPSGPVDPTTVKAAAHPVARLLRGAATTTMPAAARTPPAALRTTVVPAAAPVVAPRPPLAIGPAAAISPRPAPVGARRYPDRSMVDDVSSWAPGGGPIKTPARRLPPELAPGLITGTAGAASAYGLGQVGGVIEDMFQFA